MTTAQIVLGVALLVLGMAMLAGHRQLGRRARRRAQTMPLPPVLWVYLGAILALNGVLQLVLALA